MFYLKLVTNDDEYYWAGLSLRWTRNRCHAVVFDTLGAAEAEKKMNRLKRADVVEGSPY